MKTVNSLFKLILVSLAIGGFLLKEDICLADFTKDRVNTFISNAETYSNQGNHVVALNLYNQAIKMFPGNVELYYRRATVWGRTGQYGRAIKDLALVINRDKNSFPHAIRFRGDCFLALGYTQKAIQDYIAFLRKDPRDGKVWSYLVEAYSLAGRNDLAIQAISAGLRTGSHWERKLKILQIQILSGKKITPHKPFSN